jgi:hypothetical protein
MENSIKLKASEDTPEIIFNRDSNEFRITGRSLPEDAFVFYSPVIEWMKHYAANPNSNSELVISLDYFNSSSVKQILELLTLFEGILKTGKTAKIVWCFSDGDDLMEIKGMEFQSMLTQVPFEIKCVG